MERFIQLLYTHALFCILVLAVVLRVPFLNGSFWMDEAAQAMESVRPLSQQLNIQYDFQPPLFHLFIHVMTYFSSAEWWLRLIPLFSGLIMIWGSFEIARIVWNKQSAIIASLLLATNSFHIFFSQELRPYAFPAMWAVLSWLILVRWESEKKSQKFPVLMFALLTIAGLYSSYLYPFLLFAQLVYLLTLHRKHFSQIITSFSLATLAFLPWVPMFLEQLRIGQLLRVNTIGWESVVSIPQLKSLPLTAGKFVYGVIDLQASVFIITSLFALIASLTVLMNRFHILEKMKECRLSRIAQYRKEFFTGSWLIIPIITSWLVSFIVPVLQPKRVLFSLPALCILFALILTRALRDNTLHTRKIGQYLLVLLLLINVYGTMKYYTDARLQREDWRTAIEIIDERYVPSTTVIAFGFDDPFSPWMWYEHQDFPVVTTGTATVTSIDQIEEEMQDVLDYNEVIVFDYLRDLTDPNRTIEQYLNRYGYEQAELYDYPNIGFIRVFRKMKITASQ